MARIDERIARQIAAGMFRKMWDDWTSGDDQEPIEQALANSAQQVTLTTDGVLTLRFDVTQPKAAPADPPDEWEQEPGTPPQQADEV